MKQYLLLFFILFGTGGLLQGQTQPQLIALIVIQDQYEDFELNSISSGVKKDYALVTRFLDSLDVSGIVKVQKHLVSGQGATKAKILELIDSVPFGPKDLFLFYFSGHGGMDEGNRTFLFTTEEGKIYRDELSQRLNKRSARFKMIITDTCSSNIEALSARSVPRPRDQNTENPFASTYKHLMLGYQGTLHLASASEGEFAWSGDSGGLFTKSLFSEVLMQTPRASWQEVVNQTSKRTQEKFQYMVEMGLFDRSTQLDLQKRGILSQRPKAYTFPTLVPGTTPPVLSPAHQEGKVVIENLTGVTQAITTTQGLTSLGQKPQIYKIEAGKILELDLKNPFYVYIGERPKGEFWEMESGSYILTSDHLGETAIYWDEPSRRATNRNPFIGDWIWEEYWKTENRVFSMGMAFDPDGFFYLYRDRNVRAIEGTWKLQVIRQVPVMVLRYQVKGRSQVETYEIQKTGPDSYELTDSQDKSIGIIMTRK